MNITDKFIMLKKVDKYIKNRNNIDTRYLTINIDIYGFKYIIHGIVDLIEFDKLININCENNEITALVNIPHTVKYINCKKNKITKFEELPEGLETLMCDDNKIKFLDNLPMGLKFLSCDGNNLVRLDNLPFELKYLSCCENPICNLDFLPSGLTKLYLNEHMHTLKSLNDLPSSIEEMICSSQIERVSRINFPKDLVLFNPSLGIWKKKISK